MPHPQYDTITYAVSDGAVFITLARPDTLNLIGEKVFHELTDAVIHAQLEVDVSVVVLQSTGRMFSAGGDLNSPITKSARKGLSAELAAEMFTHVVADYPLFHAIESCPHTVIAALNGPAVGAGVTIVMMCDLIIATEAATLSFAPGRWGIADTPSAARLAQRIGTGAAKDLLFTARQLSPREALNYGLVQRISENNLEDDVRDLVDEVRATAPGVRAALKAVFHEQLPPFRIDAHFRSAISEDFFDGLKAFSAGKSAPWTPQSPVGGAARPPGRNRRSAQ